MYMCKGKRGVTVSLFMTYYDFYEQLFRGYDARVTRLFWHLFPTLVWYAQIAIHASLIKHQ